MKQPNIKDKCGLCSCVFGVHYASFDGTKTGCLTEFGQRDGRCTCKGFAVVYRPQIQTYQRPSSGNDQFKDYSGYK